jgi:flagellar hook-length control protein FliK
MIDRHLPRLREALEQQGLHLQQVEVTIAAHDQTGGQRFQESAGWQQPAPSPRNGAGQQVFTLDADESVDETLFSTANNLSVLA